jgi:hypothetical protein
MIRPIRLWTLAAAIICGALGGCAAAAEFAPDVHSVAIVSLLGDTINVDYFGVFFDGFSHARELTGAAFDDVAEQAIEERLHQTKPEVAVQRIAVERAALIKQSNSGLLSLYNADVSDIRTALKPWAAEHHVDAIIIVRQLHEAVPIQSPRSNFRGLGLYGSFSVKPPHPVASIGVIVWDGNTLEHISEAGVFLVSGAYGGYSIDNDMEGNLSGEARDHLVGDLKTLVRSAVPVLLSRVGF